MVDYSRSQDYTLSIRLSTDGFCFLVYDPRRADAYAFVPYDPDPLLPVPANLKRALASEPILQHRYGRTVVLLADEPCSLVPSELADAADEPVSNHQSLHFAPSPALRRTLASLLPEAEVHHSLQPVLRWLLATRPGRQLFCYLHEKKMDIVATGDDGEPLLATTFDYRNSADTAYYLLGTWQTLGFSQEDDRLVVAGRKVSRELLAELQRFVAHVERLDAAAAFHACELARTDSLTLDLQALTETGV